MLLDIIIWLPTLFTYLVFLLILIILFFIVVYVSHKIYISIYDNLPLPAAPGSRSSLNISRTKANKQVGSQLSARSVWIQNRSQIFDSSLVRITLTLEPCYLISVELDIATNPGQRAISFMCNCKHSLTKCAAGQARDFDTRHILKYYDHLSSVPRLKSLMRCNRRNNMRLVLNDFSNDVIEARCKDSASQCQLTTRRRKTDTENENKEPKREREGEREGHLHL